MGNIRSFRDLVAWNAAMELVLTTYTLVTKLPSAERFELGAQLRAPLFRFRRTSRRDTLAEPGNAI
jgi:hypothetical protein